MRPIPTARRTPYSGTPNTLTSTMHRPEKATIAPATIRPVPGWLGTIEVLVAVPAHRRVAGHHHVGPAATDHARQVAPEPEGRLDDAVLIPEEHEVLDTEDLRCVPRFALPHGREARVVARVLVGAGAA